MQSFWTLCRQTAFQRKTASFQTYAAPEKLNNLAAFALAHIEQTHGRNAPAGPALRKFARANQQMNRAVLLVNPGKKTGRKIIATANKLLAGFRRFEKAAGIANIDNRKRRAIFPHRKRQFALGFFQQRQMQTAARRRMKKTLQNIGVQIRFLAKKRHQRRKALMKNIVAMLIDNLRLVFQQSV